jgi:hypothetical protein
MPESNRHKSCIVSDPWTRKQTIWLLILSDTTRQHRQIAHYSFEIQSGVKQHGYRIGLEVTLSRRRRRRRLRCCVVAAAVVTDVVCGSMYNFNYLLFADVLKM